jgi:hypothetical protein
MQARTSRWKAPKGSELKCVHFSQSYGVILLLLGIIDGGLLPPIIKRLLRLRYASLCKSSSSISNTAGFREPCDVSVVDPSPEETPEEEKEDDRSNAGNRAVLFE